ncbi:RNA polymerase II-associated protein 1 [Lepeophtheirus salmonis]|uniref:RNA polymerase II-associated protein 1 n=1 Tax=Lepeophtheirus salmonis TaxID=72036 RepID=UPI001AE161FE|nr:RNA polymerase II-associated protein 1-like [Lepeophtheirus salmonis]
MSLMILIKTHILILLGSFSNSCIVSGLICFKGHFTIFIEEKTLLDLRMFPQRPRPGETEEDILKQQDKFHGGRKRSKFAESRLKETESSNAPSPPSAVLLQPRIMERDFSGLLQSDPLTQEPSLSSFPSTFKLSSQELTEKTNRGQSFFAKAFSKDSLKLKKGPLQPPPFVELPKRDFGNKSNLLSGSQVFNDIVLQEIHEENIAKLCSMPEEEILLEKKKILESLDPKIMEFLKRKVSQTKPESIDVIKEEVSDKMEEDASSNNSLEQEKRKWMENITTKEEENDILGLPARFDFKGEIMEGEKNDDFDAGLHHHGEEPHRAGYTLDELLTLSRSTFPQQKNLALETLSAVVRNYKKGLFDGIFDVNILDSLLKSGLIEVLRMGMDEKIESIIFASANALSEFLYNECDEVCLDLSFNYFKCYVQPSLPTEVSTRGTTSHAEYESEKTELKDSEIIQLDVIYALLRMDILDRIAYIIMNLNPGVGVTIACLKILIRIARHTKQSARTILHHPKLLKQIEKLFLPSLIHSYSSSSNPIRGSPVHLALKLIRIIVSWDINYAVFITSTQKNIGDALLSYIAYDPTSSDHNGPEIPTLEGLSLVLESFRFWQILLRYKLGIDHYLNFYPILLRQMLYYVNKVDLTDVSPNKKYVYDHGGALIQVLEAAVLNLGTSNHLDWSHFQEIFSLLETCAKKWCCQVNSLAWSNTLPSSKVAIANMVASTMRALGTFYWKYSEQKQCIITDLLTNHVRIYVNEILATFFNTVLFKELMNFSFISSSLNLTSEFEFASGKNRDPKNLPSFGSVVYRGSVVPSISENSPYNFIVSALYSFLLCKELDKSLVVPDSLLSNFNSNEASLERIIKKSNVSNLLINSNWFTRIEAYYWTLQCFVTAELKINCPHLRSVGRLSLSFLHTWDDELALELCKKVMFSNTLQLKSEEFTTNKLKKLSLNPTDATTPADELADFSSLYLKYLFPSASLLQRSKEVFSSSGTPQSLTQSNAGELLLPRDWPFLPLLTLHNTRSESDSPTTEKEKQEIQLCLKWIIIYDCEDFDPFPGVTFTRLCTVFLAAPDLFLDTKIREYTRIIFQKVLTNWKDLDLSKEIPGTENFFYVI